MKSNLLKFSIIFYILLIILYTIYLQRDQINTIFVFNQRISYLWTFDGSGSMKYIQWIRIRKLATVRIIRLNEKCQVKNEEFHETKSSTSTLQVFVLSLHLDRSACSATLPQLTHQNSTYFHRRSFQATIVFEYVDENKSLTSISSEFDRIKSTIEFISNYFPSNRIDAEELIHSKIVDCERALRRFFEILKIPLSKSILDADAHLFIEDALWWDRSDVAERLLTDYSPILPSELNTTDDFYYLHGNRSFREYLYRNRRCVVDGLFAQLESENHTSFDEPNRCLSKPFDCAFSDIYSFDEREQLYKQINRKSIKCGFAVPSIFDTIRTRFYRNETCQVVIFTLITNCYDPLPVVRGNLLPTFCLLAFVDAQTENAYKTFYTTPVEIKWEVINLGNQATPFSVEAKSTETLKLLGERLFPLAKWIVWVDGKSHVVNLNEILREARTPLVSAQHDRPNRTSAAEVNETIIRLTRREKTPVSMKFNNTLRDIRLLEQQYQFEGFYNQSDQLGLRMFDIAILIYRNHHPCIQRYLCGWHNEINYYAYRGQLSVFYSAVRLNLTAYLDYISSKHYFIFDHKTVC